MKLRKLIALCIALLACVVTQAKSENSVLSSGSGVYNTQTTIVLSVNQDYIVLIPPSIPLVYGAEQTELPLQIHDLNLTKNAALSVSVAEPTGKLQQKNGEGMIPYTLTDENGTFHEKEFTETGTYPLSVKVDPGAWYAAPAGKYDGTITFTVSVKAKEGGE